MRWPASGAGVLLACWAVVAPVHSVQGGQTSSRQDTTIAGRVVDGISGRGISGATVRLYGRSQGGPLDLETESGSGGAFSLSLPGASSGLRLLAQAAGYLQGVFGMAGPTEDVGLILELGEGERLENIVLRVWPEAIVEGQVADAEGNPLVGVDVEALTRVYSGVGWRFVRAGRRGVRTDAQGFYRITRLRPGDYVVGVRAVSEQEAGQAVLRTYSPAASTAGTAGTVSLEPGSVFSADISVDLDQTFGAIVGQLTGGDRPVGGFTVRLLPTSPDGSYAVFDERTAIVDDAGRFRFESVPEGLYRLTVREFPTIADATYFIGGDLTTTLRANLRGTTLSPLPDAPTWWADVTIGVGAGQTAVVQLPLQPGARVSGRIVFDGTTQPPSSEQLLTVPVIIRPADGGPTEVNPLTTMPQPRIEADGRFTSIGLPPGDYVVNVEPSAPALEGWKTAAVQFGSRDLLGRVLTVGPLDIDGVTITMSDRVTRLSGTVWDSNGSPAVEARVIVFPQNPDDRGGRLVDPAPARVVKVPVNRFGIYSVDLPPGDYLVAAVTDSPPYWMVPDFLETLVAFASDVQLDVGDQRTVNLEVQRRSTQGRETRDSLSLPRGSRHAHGTSRRRPRAQRTARSPGWYRLD